MSSVKSTRIPPLSKADADRYWSHVDRNSDHGGCWVWTGSVNSKGYGRFFAGGRHHGAHRLAWLLAGRAIQRNLLICHTCDNKKCVNPAHLLMGDEATNTRDAMLKRNLQGKHAAAKKPHKDFPLFPHATRRWAKKIKGKLQYFGSTVDDPQGEAALQRFLDQKDALYAGRKPRKGSQGLTVRDLCNRYLASKYDKLQNGEISPRTFADCKLTTDRIVNVFGKTRVAVDLDADDFRELRIDIAKTRNPESLGNEINRVRGVFKFAFENHLIDRPVRYGSDFKRPPKRVLRKVRNGREKKFFDAVEIRKMLDAANLQLKCMILLGVNCGLGNSDNANLPIEAIDLQAAWLDFPRPKTGIERRCPLWPETVKAVKDWLAVRPTPKDKEAFGHLLFITAKTRTTWAKDARVDANGTTDVDQLAQQCSRTSDNPISKEMRKLLNNLGIQRKGVSFYSLRHVFETVGGDARDQVALDHIMGHARNDMASVYREGISGERLEAVTDYVRTWLFGGQAGNE